MAQAPHPEDQQPNFVERGLVVDNQNAVSLSDLLIPSPVVESQGTQDKAPKPQPQSGKPA